MHLGELIKIIYIFQYYILNKCCSFEPYIWILKKKLKKKTIFNINNNTNLSWAPNLHIRMISEGSCDTED